LVRAYRSFQIGYHYLQVGQEVDFFFGNDGFESRRLAVPMYRAQLIDGIWIVLGKFVIPFGEAGQVISPFRI
jgi:hypothetical protein